MEALGAAQHEIVARADRLTREKIAPRAAEYDQAAANPVESWRELGGEGFLAASIPRAHGGLGLDMPTYIAVIRTIARGCASTAMTLHMHSTVMRFIDALGTDGQKRRYYGEVVGGGKLFGSWGSEPAVSLSRTFLMETSLRADGDGYVIDGVKHFCTMALGASYYMVWCALDGGTDMAKALLLALVPADAAGIATDGKWNTLGMRATYSPSVTFRGVRVARDATLGELGGAIRVGVVESFGLGYAAIYLGIAEAALEFAMDYVRKRIVRPENVAVAEDPTVQRHIGELRVHLDAALLVLADSAARWAQADMVERGNLANRAKLLATQVGLDTTSRVIQVVGGRGAYKEYLAERAFRDLRTSTLMPPTVDRMLEAIGKNALGLETGMFRLGSGPQGA
ncbi:MAG: acyl-CoA/acyl-ACP dehydrogenase [Candidatus Rokubacteria bacterium]|nr:acyl-CoA/acyl-ACP dehydrogenase [Candidatus Rokubacteria bacterium]